MYGYIYYSYDDAFCVFSFSFTTTECPGNPPPPRPAENCNFPKGFLIKTNEFCSGRQNQIFGSQINVFSNLEIPSPHPAQNCNFLKGSLFKNYSILPRLPKSDFSVANQCFRGLEIHPPTPGRKLQLFKRISN